MSPSKFGPCSLKAEVFVQDAAPLTGLPVLLPVADGICVLNNDFVHPGERLRKQYSSLKEAQVAPMLGQCKYHIGHFLYTEIGEQRRRSKYFLFKQRGGELQAESC